MKNKASKRKKKESTPKRRSQGSRYPNPSAGKNSNRRSNYPPSDAGDTVGYEEEYYDVSNIDESMAYIGFKALAATKIVLLFYSLISCFHLQVTEDCYSCEEKGSMVLNVNLAELYSTFHANCFSTMTLMIYPVFFIYFCI